MKLRRHANQHPSQLNSSLFITCGQLTPQSQDLYVNMKLSFSIPSFLRFLTYTLKHRTIQAQLTSQLIISHQNNYRRTVFQCACLTPPATIVVMQLYHDNHMTSIRVGNYLLMLWQHNLWTLFFSTFRWDVLTKIYDANPFCFSLFA